MYSRQVNRTLFYARCRHAGACNVTRASITSRVDAVAPIAEPSGRSYRPYSSWRLWWTRGRAIDSWSGDRQASYAFQKVNGEQPSDYRLADEALDRVALVGTLRLHAAGPGRRYSGNASLCGGADCAESSCTTPTRCCGNQIRPVRVSGHCGRRSKSRTTMWSEASERRRSRMLCSV